jgi:hypothetical protein
LGTKNSPAKYDCYANAEPDEPMFVLLARDPVAPMVVDLWVQLRRHLQKSPTTADDIEQRLEAQGCAEAMRYWRAKNRR